MKQKPDIFSFFLRLLVRFAAIFSALVIAFLVG